MNLYPVILAGGSGTRLWPLSRRVKRICMAPGEKLSLQWHHHRAEHWVVVSGTARVTKGEDDIVRIEDVYQCAPQEVTP